MKKEAHVRQSPTAMRFFFLYKVLKHLIAMLSKNKIKYIHSLEQKSHRNEENAFLAEGPKLVGELLGNFRCKLLVAKAEWLRANPNVHAQETIEVSREELTKASLLKTPQDVLAVFEKPQDKFDMPEIRDSLSLALDNVQDPGNLGTIIRIADWFGIGHIFCSIGTADAFNPKTVQATMGALARVRLHYCDLKELLRSLDKDIPVFGTFLDGENIYTTELSSCGVIVMGNEGNGICKEIEKTVNKRLLVPHYPQGKTTGESLNVGAATAIVCAEFRRRMS